MELTQEEFARLLGVVRAAVEHWEAGRNKPSRRNLRKIYALREDYKRGSVSVSKIATKQVGRVKAETRLALHEALDLILDQATDTVVDQIAEILTARAGAYSKGR